VSISHLHITLVGGQPAPVYQGILFENPDKVIFICSTQTLDEAQKMSVSLSIPSEVIEVSPVDVNLINSSINKIDISKYDKVSINISGGTKIWSILFYEYFKNNDKVEIIYIDQNNTVWNLKTKTFKDQELIHDIKSYFSFFNINLKTSKEINALSDNDSKICKAIEEMRNYCIKEFNDLIQNLSSKNHLNEYTTKKGSKIKYDSHSKTFHVLLKKNSGSKEWVISSPNVRYLLLNTGWFEYKVAQILSNWKHCKQILLNCEFASQDNNNTMNEVDIIVNTGKKLLFVECKTQVFNSIDIDKFATVIRNYGGLASKGLLVTDAKLTNNVEKKCNNSGILTFSFENTHKFNVNPEQLLFLKLESEWLNINPK